MSYSFVSIHPVLLSPTVNVILLLPFPLSLDLVPLPLINVGCNWFLITSIEVINSIIELYVYISTYNHVCMYALQQVCFYPHVKRFLLGLVSHYITISLCFIVSSHISPALYSHILLLQ